MSACDAREDFSRMCAQSQAQTRSARGETQGVCVSAVECGVRGEKDSERRSKRVRAAAVSATECNGGRKLDRADRRWQARRASAWRREQEGTGGGQESPSA